MLELKTLQSIIATTIYAETVIIISFDKAQTPCCPTNTLLGPKLNFYVRLYKRITNRKIYVIKGKKKNILNKWTNLYIA
jgi:hypothetical protein